MYILTYLLRIHFVEALVFTVTLVVLNFIRHTFITIKDRVYSSLLKKNHLIAYFIFLMLAFSNSILFFLFSVFSVKYFLCMKEHFK